MRFFSLFVVTPYLTKEPSIYGIYAVCVSVTIFLGYADLGFLMAGQKYASESYTRGDRTEEMQYIGFGAFVLLIFTLLCSFGFLYLGFHPQRLIKGLTPGTIDIASNLLFILAAFAPVTVLQRMVAMIFDIRLNSYVNQRISLFASFITIGSVFYFFRNGSYSIVPYFLLSQSINLLVVLIAIWVAKKKYTYNVTALLKYIRFDKKIYNKANSLAYSGLYIMVMWILFYEVDQLVISKFLGAEKVAIYAIAITFTTFFRTIFGILFSPFSVRSNYFIGNDDEEGLRKFCLQLMTLSAPLTILPTIAFAIVAKPFVFSWVGPNYVESVDIARLISFVYTLAFISYPASIYLNAKAQVKENYVIATLQPLIYWVGIVSVFSFLGLFSFGLFKLIATLLADCFYFYILIKSLKLSFSEFCRNVFYPIMLPLLFLIIALTFANNYFPYDKSKINLFIVLGVTGTCILISFGIQYMVSPNIKVVVKKLIGGITKTV